MSDQPAAVHRRLNDDEKDLLAQLAAWRVAEQTGTTTKIAADVLGELAERGEIHVYGDAQDAYLTASGHPIVHVTREWLAFFANNPDEKIDIDKYFTSRIPAEQLAKLRKMREELDR